MAKTVAVVFGGGHVSSWHAGLYGVVKKAEETGRKVIGFRDGFVGANNGVYYELTSKEIEPDRSGVLIGASRAKVNPAKVKDTLAKLKRSGVNVEAIVGFCGDDHLKQLHKLWAEEEIPVVGWPKTMDNDISNTYFALGYPTAAVHAIEAVRRGYTTAWTYARCHIISMFGRDTDWVAAAAGGFAPADLVIGGEIDESSVYTTKYNIDYLLQRIKQIRENNRIRYGRPFAVIAIAEGAKIDRLESHLSDYQMDVHGHLKIEPEKLVLSLKYALLEIDKNLDISTDTLTYDNLRNCSPVEIDKELSIRAGERCIEALDDGQTHACAVISCDRQSGEFSVDLATLPDVYEKRRLRAEGFMDYDRLEPTREFLEYYEPLFGKAKTHEEILPARPPERVV